MSLIHEFNIQNTFHLVGEQTLPVYLAALQFPVETTHYLLATEKTRRAAERIATALKLKEIKSEIKLLGEAQTALSYEKLIGAFNKIVQETGNPQTGAFELTGGTKLMAFAGLIAANSAGQPAFYVDTPGQKFVCINRPKTEYDLESDMYIADFVALSGLKLRPPKKNTLKMKQDLLDYMFKNSQVFQRYQSDFSACTNAMALRNKGQKGEALFQKTSLEISKNLSGWDKKWSVFCTDNKLTENWQTQAKFLAGGWFEHYLYEKLRRSDPRIKEILINAEVALPQDGNEVFQEFDVVYTDGYSLIILECKAGQVLQEYVQKLKSIRNDYCGALGKCAMVTLNSSKTKNSRKASFAARIEHSGAIAAFCGKSGLKTLNSICFDFKPGKIYE